MAGRQKPVENVNIQLEHDIDEQYQYQPGEIIRGNIVVHLVRNTLIQSIHLTITGDGVCSWDEEDYGTQQSNENYIDATQAIFTSKDANYLDSGYHSYPFKYRLPDNIPSSFIGKFGSVTYILKAVIEGERPSDNAIATEPFLVARKCLLPEEVCERADFQEARTYFGMCSWGKVKVNLHLSKTGYVPGEDICLQAEVQNRCPLRVTAIQAALIMNSSYHAQKNKVSYKQIINKRRDDYELDDGDGRRWQNVRISVPPYIPESFLQCCDIIDLSYMFQFRVELMGGKELKIDIPMIIGSNPKGLEVPADYNDDENKHWRSGPRELSRQQNDEQLELKNKWIIESPEFREDTQVINPLFRNESLNKGSGDKPYHKKSGKSSRHHDFDDIQMDFREMDHNTKM